MNNSRGQGAESMRVEFTPREQSILKLLSRKLTNRQIAKTLTVENSTVRWYLRQIYRKLGVGDRRDAVQQAQTLGLLPEKELPPANLPANLTPFFGRKQILSTLDEFIVNKGARLVTLIGPGGVGKTRLALAVAKRQRSHVRSKFDGTGETPLFDDGVWFIPLASVDSPEQLVSQIAGTVGLQLKTGDGQRVEKQLIDYLHEKRMLIVLDSFEHLLNGAAFLNELLSIVPDLNLLVTSRERLQLTGEQVFSIEGLDVPSEDAPTNMVMRSASVQLFVNTAQRIRPGFEPDKTEITDLARICRLVDGMPLALVLAASWVEALPLSEIANRIEQSVEFLATNLRDVPERQRSIISTLDAAWRYLDASLRDIFLRLSVFQGGFTRDAALAVADAKLQNLVSLLNKSWLHYDPELDHYDIHELLRQYGQNRLKRSGFGQEVRDRHGAYYCSLSSKLGEEWESSSQAISLNKLKNDHGNFHMAWRHAIEQSHVQRLRSAIDGLCIYFEWYARFKEAQKLLDKTVTLLRALADNSTEDRSVATLLLRVLVWCARFAGSYGEARAFLNQSRALLDKLNQEKIDLRREEASLCLQEGETEGLLNPEKARPYFQRALALYGKMDDSIGVAKTQLWLGHTEWDTGHYDEAEALLKQALASHQKIGNRRWIVKSLESLGLVHKHIGKFEQAENNHRESFELAREIGDRSLIWTVGTTLAHTLLKTGKYEQAHMLAEDCLCMAREGGNQIDVVYATCALASASIYLGHYDEARSHTEFLIHDARKLGFRQAAGVIRTIEGKLAMIDRDFENAVRLFEESAQLLRKYRKGTWMDPLMWKAYSLRQLGMRKQSRESVAKALQASLDIRAFHTTLLAFPIVALFLADNGKRQRAVELYSLAQRYAHVTDTPWFNEVAGRELTELAISLPDADAARQQGQKEDLWQTARDLLSDLTGWGYIISSE